MSVTTYDYAGYSYDAPVSYDNPLQQLGIGCRISTQGGCRGNTIYNAPGVSYNQSLYIYNPTVCPNGSLSVQARITRHSAQTILVRCDIKNQNAQTITCQARISKRSTATVTCQARISTKSTRTITCQARISTKPTSTVTCQARISKRSTATINCQARIGTETAQTITCQARISSSSTQTFTCRADIVKQTNETLTCQARILAAGQHAGFQTVSCQARIMPYRLSIQARIRHSATQQISMKVWFSRQQGFPIIDPSSPAFPLFQPTQLILKANIVNNITRTTRTMLLNCRISPLRSYSMAVNCRINHSGRIRIQANITPKYKTTTVLGTFNIEGVFGLTVLGYFNINGLYSRPTLGVGARIVRLVSRRVVGHFIIPAQPSTGPVSTLTAGGSASSRANLGIGAFIS